MPSKAKPSDPCERLLRAAVREFLALRDADAHGIAGGHLERILFQLTMWAHQSDPDDALDSLSAVAVEIDGTMVVVDGADSLDHGFRAHVVERINTIVY